MFGRGLREELDDEEGEGLARAMRIELAHEVERIQKVEGVDFGLGSSDSTQRGKL